MRRIYPQGQVKKTVAAITAAALAATLVSCSGQLNSPKKREGDTLQVYSGLPLEGSLKDVSESIVRGEKMALTEAGNKSGDFNLGVVALNDAKHRGWTSTQTAMEARRATRDKKGAAYIGDLNSGACDISLPILNEGDYLQVTPSCSAVGLTKVFPGAKPGEPDIYYPSGRRSLVRLAAADDVLADGAARWSKELGAKSVYILHDESYYGRGLAQQFENKARELNLKGLGSKVVDPDRSGGDLAAAVAQRKPDLVFYGGEQTPQLVRVWQELHISLPDAKLLATSSQDGLMEKLFYSNLRESAKSTYLITPILNPKQLPKEGQGFIAKYREKFKQEPEELAVYGYAAMEIVLEAIKNSGEYANDRKRIIQEAFKLKGFKTAIGKITVDENGDTNIRQLAGYRVKSGKLVFDQPVAG